MNYENIINCRCCNSNRLFQYLDLGMQPLANSYHKGEELPKYPLAVNLCEDCFHSQLSIVVEPSLMFQHYLYVSGTTSTFRKHCEDLAFNVISRTGPCKVLDIAANDGTLLACFRNLGCEVYGVDPAENIREISKEKDIPVTVGYWGSGTVQLEGKFDIITGTNVFAHVHPVRQFLKECKAVLAENGMIVLEFPYCDTMIAEREFDTIYHEHLSYFLVNSFKTLVNSLDLFIVDIVLTKIHGGSIRFFLKENAKNCQRVEKLIEKEREKGLFDIQTYARFSAQVVVNKYNIRSLVQRLKEQGKKGQKIIGFGAAAKANTALNYFDIYLDYIVDDNPMKWGYLTPGKNIPICSPETLRNEKNSLYIFILTWNFAQEIISKIKNIRTKEQNDIQILYVPSIKITNLYE